MLPPCLPVVKNELVGRSLRSGLTPIEVGRDAAGRTAGSGLYVVRLETALGARSVVRSR